MPAFYEQTLCILQKCLLTNPDLHHGLLGICHRCEAEGLRISLRNLFGLNNINRPR